jgi:hypothetical protein
MRDVKIMNDEGDLDGSRREVDIQKAEWNGMRFE